VSGYTQPQKEVLDFFAVQRNAVLNDGIPMEWFTVADINGFVNKAFPWHGERSRSTTGRVLASLIRAGVVERTKDQGVTFYRWSYAASPGVGS
jgi:hypothetical protein